MMRIVASIAAASMFKPRPQCQFRDTYSALNAEMRSKYTTELILNSTQDCHICLILSLRGHYEVIACFA